MVRAVVLRRSSGDGQGVVGWGIFEKDGVGKGSSTTKLRVVVGLIVSAPSDRMRCCLTGRI